MTDGFKETYVLSDGALEYYCFDCKRLRGHLDTTPPKSCRNCRSTNITVDAMGSDRLKQLGFGDSAPDAPITTVLIK